MTFCYNYLKKKRPLKAKSWFTNTGSQSYVVERNDVYKDKFEFSK